MCIQCAYESHTGLSSECEFVVYGFKLPQHYRSLNRGLQIIRINLPLQERPRWWVVRRIFNVQNCTFLYCTVLLSLL